MYEDLYEITLHVKGTKEQAESLQGFLFEQKEFLGQAYGMEITTVSVFGVPTNTSDKIKAEPEASNG